MTISNSSPHQHSHLTNGACVTGNVLISNCSTSHQHIDHYQEAINKLSKENDELKFKNEIFKRILLVKNICTEEEIDDIENSINMEKKLSKK